MLVLRVLALLPVFLAAVPSSHAGARITNSVGANTSMRGAPSPAGGHVLVARGRIAFLAADRGRVALSVVYGASPTVAVWNPARRSVVRFPTDLRDGMHVWPDGLALIGDTVAWL